MSWPSLGAGVLVLYLQIVCVLRQGTEAWPLKCPVGCFCNIPSKIVYCSRRNLPMVPKEIPEQSKQLMLTGNLFQSNLLQRANLTSFVDLEHLYLSECGIEYIEVDTFIDLSKLKWLDLSNNRIKILPDFTFRGLRLKHLFLNGNRNIALKRNSFSGLHTEGLYLHDCSLKEITVDVLKPLNASLKKLWLNGNEIEKLHKSLLQVFASLNHLRLGGNPLHCNCEMVWLKGFYDQHPTLFNGAPPPSCYTPKAIETRYFNDLYFTDFKCQTPVFSNIDASFNDNTGRLRCTAAGDPLPTLFWIKPRGQMIKYAPPPAGVVRYNEGILRISTDHDISGQYRCLASNAAGNVTLNINVTWPKPPVVPPPATGVETHQHTRPGVPVNGAPLPTYGTPIHNNPGPNKNNRSQQITVETTLTREKSGRGRDRGHDDHDHYDDDHNHHKVDTWGWGHGPVRYFSLSELIGAVIGTHVATLLLCLLCTSCYYRHKMKNHYPREHYYDRAYDRTYDRAYSDRGSKLYVATDRDERMYMSKLPEHEHIYESPKR